jgi:hypothetical protein
MSKGSLEREFERFASTVRDNDALDQKTTVMLHLAVTMAVGCYP